MLELLMAAREGDFAGLSEVIQHMKQNDDDLHWGEASFLLSYAAPSSVLHELVYSFSKEIFVDKDFVIQSWIAETLLNSGLLWTVPEALRILTAQTERDSVFSIPARLSFLLETKPGEVFAGPERVTVDGPWPDWYDDAPFVFVDEPYLRLVLQAYEQHLAAAARWAGETVFLLGEPVDIQKLALSTLMTVGKSGDTEELSMVRTVLEAQTGFDLSGFYRNGILDRMGAIAALEALFDSVNFEAFAPGRRYFFGRPLPE